LGDDGSLAKCTKINGYGAPNMGVIYGIKVLNAACIIAKIINDKIANIRIYIDINNSQAGLNKKTMYNKR